MKRGRHIRLAVTLTMIAAPGCSWLGLASSCGPAGRGVSGPALTENPFFTSVADREFLWNQVVDTIDDYFKIKREQRVRAVGDVLTEGNVETFPTVGSTLLEPWRRDSTPGFERLQSTLQSIRRRAQVRVTPIVGGHMVEVAVFKELEDLERPEHATIGSRAESLYEGTLVRDRAAVVGSTVSLGWIPQGRDVSLEQRIVRELQGRLAEAPSQSLGAGMHQVP